MSLERINLHISRSGVVGMSYRMEAPRSRRNTDNFVCKCKQWELLKLHSTRWSHLEIIVYNLFPDDLPPGHYCLTSPFQLSLPTLTSSTMEIYGENFLIELTAPKLEICTFKASVAESSLQLIGAQLKHVRIEMETGEGIVANNMMGFLSRSYVASCITSLSIRFLCAFGMIRYSNPEVFMKNATLEKVEMLEIDIANDDYETGEYELGLLRHIKTPNVKHLRARVLDRPDMLQWLGDLVTLCLERFEVVIANTPHSTNWNEADERERIVGALLEGTNYSLPGGGNDARFINVEFE
jgi:hypothetical protein